ncbi:AAA family ATPase [Parabacteroides sp.]
MKKLYVERFGPVKAADLELREVNLFIGSQSIGKSTLAKLITILSDHISLCKLVGAGYKSWEEQLKIYNLGVYIGDEYKIVYDWEEKGIHLHLEARPKELSSYMEIDGEKTTDKDFILNEIVKLKPVFHEENALNVIREPREKNISTSILEVMNNSLYIPAERIIYSVIANLLPAFTLAKASVPQNLLRFMVELENAKATYPQYEIPLLDISYEYRGAEDYFMIHEQRKVYPLMAASSGIQSTIPLLLVLQYAIEHREYSSFVIEEPECNLFPEKQVELFQQILAMVKADGRTLTITTHSPYLLSAMNNYLFAGTLVDKYGDKIREDINNILPKSCLLKMDDCAVYSLGENINGEGCYCRSLLDEETGMIDYNYLDGVSEKLGNEFEALEDAFIQMKHKK